MKEKEDIQPVEDGHREIDREELRRPGEIEFESYDLVTVKASWKIWLIPLLAVLFIIAYGAFVRWMIGPTSEQHIDYGITEFVPGESPYSTGPDSR